MNARVRPWVEDDIPDIVRYWKTLSAADASRMGCDVTRIASTEDYSRLLREQLQAPTEQTSACYSMWMINGNTSGFASLKNIEFGVRGEMHLHLWDAAQRGKGLGGQLFCLSAVDFYDQFKLQEIVCEPGATNPLPNRMLQKAGFTLVGSRVGKSSDISMEVELNTYAITRPAALRYLSNRPNHP